jgi:hypothetical protein
MARQVAYAFICTPAPGDIAIPPGGGSELFSGRRGIYVPTRGVLGSEGGGSNTPFAYLDGRKIVVPSNKRAIYVPIDAEGWGDGPCCVLTSARTLKMPWQSRVMFMPITAEGPLMRRPNGVAMPRTIDVYDGEGYTHR